MPSRKISFTHPQSHATLLSASVFALEPAFEIVLAGNPEGEDEKAMLTALRGTYMPSATIMLADEGLRDSKGIAKYMESMKSIEGRATAYVCMNHSCALLTTSIDEMLEMVGERK